MFKTVLRGTGILLAIYNVYIISYNFMSTGSLPTGIDFDLLACFFMQATAYEYYVLKRNETKDESS